MKLTQERLKELLSYDPETGIFSWVKRTSNRVKPGSVAGCLNADGYVVIKVDGVLFQANRLAVFWMTGRLPIRLIDHRNRCRCDNSWDNLREASHSQNSANSTTHRDNLLGLKGVHLHKKTGRYRAQIMILGKRKSLGLHDTPQLAHSAYANAARAAFGAFANTGGGHG